MRGIVRKKGRSRSCSRRMEWEERSRINKWKKRTQKSMNRGSKQEAEEAIK